MRASVLSFRAATVLALVGMSAGIGMAVSGNHALMPAHAHLNLLGWVSMFLMGVFYKLHPALDIKRRAQIQVWAWLISTLLLTAGVALIYLGLPQFEPLAGVGSVGLLAAMMAFAIFVAWPEGAKAASVPLPAAAE